MRAVSVLLLSLAVLGAGCAEEAAAPSLAPPVRTDVQDPASAERPERAERVARRAAEPAAAAVAEEAGTGIPGSKPLPPELESRLRAELTEMADDEGWRLRWWSFGQAGKGGFDLEPFGAGAEARLWYLLDTLELDDPLLRGVQRALGAAGAASKDVMARLRSDAAAVRSRALGVLAREWDCPPESAAEVGRVIRSGLTSRDEEERRSAAAAAGRLAPQCGDFTPELMDAFVSGAPPTQAEAVKALVGTTYTGSDGVFSSPAFASRRAVLRAALAHDESDVRIAALVALRARGGSARTFEPAVALRLRDTAPDVRKAAADAFDYMKPSDVSIPGLLEAIADPVHDVRHRALWAFANHAMGEEVPLDLVLREVRAGRAERLSTPEVMVLSKHGVESAEALPYLLACVAQTQGDGNYERPYAIAALCAVAPGDEEVYERLQACSWAAYIPTVEACARGLGRFGERSIPRLTALLDRNKHADFEVKIAAADGLVHIGDAALPALIERLDAPRDDTRKAVQRAIERLYAGSPSLEARLSEVLHSPSASLRARGVEAVGALEIPSQALFDTLADLLHDPVADVRRCSADALLRHRAVPDSAAADLRDMLARDPPPGRLLAARALARLHPKDPALPDALRELVEQHPGAVRLGASNLLKELSESDDRNEGE
jgi:hypothetical protein